MECKIDHDYEKQLLTIVSYCYLNNPNDIAIQRNCCNNLIIFFNIILSNTQSMKLPIIWNYLFFVIKIALIVRNNLTTPSMIGCSSCQI